LKVESGDNQYTKIYSKKDLNEKAFENDELLSNKDKLKKEKGGKVFIKVRTAELQLMKYDLEKNEVFEGEKN